MAVSEMVPFFVSIADVGVYGMAVSLGLTQKLFLSAFESAWAPFYYATIREPDAPRVFHNSRTLSEHGVITMPYLKNLDRIEKDRFTLIGLPLKMIGAEASPVRAVAVY